MIEQPPAQLSQRPLTLVMRCCRRGIALAAERKSSIDFR